MSELKPCPFCGGEATISSVPEGTWDKFIPHCKSVGCLAFYIGFSDEGLYGTKEKAIEAWNRRVDDGKSD